MHRSGPVTDVAHAGMTVPDLDDALALWCDDVMSQDIGDSSASGHW
jgi:hypothetical protein